WAGSSNRGPLGDEEYGDYRTRCRAIQSRILQHSQPYESWAAQSDRVLRKLDLLQHQSFGWIDHDAGHGFPTDSVRVEGGLLKGNKAQLSKILRKAHPNFHHHKPQYGF